ncbi:hypothetical protein [Nannocystis exedens]|uniref:hypothetical protein n=1 Tax=Nannocystis exedens TaxID=54 RepID=UPI000BB9FE36|nr:hypothetical protein [Nannocystis exedens]PCC66469.1 hypothetical protein NAEX_09057 [Nannocystis exedens]
MRPLVPSFVLGLALLGCQDDPPPEPAGLEEHCEIDTDNPAYECGPQLACNVGDDTPRSGDKGYCANTCQVDSDCPGGQVCNDNKSCSYLCEDEAECPKDWMLCGYSSTPMVFICQGTPMYEF